MTFVRSIFRILGPELVASIIRITTNVYNGVSTTFKVTTDFVQSCSNYLNGISNTWVFLKDNVGPIPLCMVENEEDIVWLFHANTRTLIYKNKDTKEKNIRHYLPWLSASIYCDGTLYDFDECCEFFSYCSPNNVHPKAKLIMSCWAILNKRWFNSSQNVYFEVINVDGDVHRCPVFNCTMDDLDVWSTIFANNECSDTEEECDNQEDGENENEEEEDDDDDDDEEDEEDEDDDDENEENEEEDEDETGDTNSYDADNEETSDKEFTLSKKVD